MKLISLCIKIQIPVIYHKHHYSEIYLTDQYINERQTRYHVESLAEKKLVPFLRSAGNLSEQFGKRFNLAVSLSGISVKLLEKYAPIVLDEIKLLARKGVIEFLAEPWSHSVLPYFIQKEFSQQTELHRKTIKAAFGQVPTVFMADLPLNEEVYSGFGLFPGCQTALTCSNHLSKNTGDEKPSQNQKAQFLINNTLSQKLQQVSSDDFQFTASNFITPVKRYLRKHATLVKPLILVFNPVANNISSYRKWEKIISQLLINTQGTFYSLSDLEEISNYFAIENDYSEDLLPQFKQPDYWLKNNMQKEAFSQFKNIYKTIQTNNYSYSPEGWDFLQDMNNFFYMSDAFFIEEFTKQHFTPFRSPHEAFTSYMNAISNFWIVSQKKPKPFIKTNFLITPAIN